MQAESINTDNPLPGQHQYFQEQPLQVARDNLFAQQVQTCQQQPVSFTVSTRGKQPCQKQVKHDMVEKIIIIIIII